MTQAAGWTGEGRKTLFIASEVRSGSTFVAETLAYELHAALGYEMWQLLQELFQDLDEQTTAEAALSRLAHLHIDSCGFAGAKLVCRQMSHLRRLANASPALNNALFGPGAYWIVIRRSDRVAQAVSLAAARKSGVYHHYDDPPSASDLDIPLSQDEIGAALAAISQSEVFLDLWTRLLPPERTLSLVYEDFLIDQIGALQAIHALCGFPPMDVAAFINRAKLKPRGSQQKRRATAEYKEWLLSNYF